MPASDEPTRLAQIIVPEFSDESKGWETSLANGSNATLIAGALAQDDCAVFRLHGDQDLVLGSDYVPWSKISPLRAGLPE